MIRERAPRLAGLVCVALATIARAEAPPPAAPPDQPLEHFRTPLDVLTERAIGTTTRPVRFDWRRSAVGFGVTGSQLVELNTFWSWAVGVVVRKPFAGVLGQLTVRRVETSETDSSQKLALTPYRQYGRPSRFELEVGVDLPLAEGVVTAWPRFFPAAEVVLSATGALSYSLYLESFHGAKWTNTADFFAPTLVTREKDNLLSTRPPGMEVDSARYALFVGLSTDVYFQSGFFVSLRTMVALPLPLEGSRLGWWWAPSLSLGLAL